MISLVDESCTRIRRVDMVKVTTSDWEGIRFREVSEERVGPPDLELASALRKCADVLGAERDAARKSNGDWRDAMAEVAIAVDQLGRLLEHNRPDLVAANLGGVHDSLRVLKDKIVAAHEAAEVHALDPTGFPFSGVVDLVEVAGWVRQPELEREIVVETLQPVILHGSDLVKEGIVKAGAPQCEGIPGETVQRED